MKKIPLEEAYQKATHGPLSVHLHGDSDFDGLTVESGCGLVATVPSEHDPQQYSDDEENRVNAALLAHAFNVLPKVVAALKRTEGILSGRDKAPMEFDEMREWERVLAEASTVEVPE